MVIKNKLKFIRFIFLIIILFWGIYQLFVYLFVDEHNTYEAQYQVAPLSNTYEGLVIRKEKIFTTNIAGTINYKINSGNLISKGELVAELMKGSIEGSDAQEVVSTAAPSYNKVSSEVIKQEVLDLKRNIIESIRSNNIEKVQEYEQKLKLKLELLVKINSNDQTINTEELSHYSDTSSDSNIKFYSNYSGIFSNNFDNLDKVLKVEDLYLLNYNEILTQKVVKKPVDSLVKKGEKVYKIIDNFSYYIAYVIPFQDIELYKNISYLDVLIGDQIYEASVYDVFENFSKGILVLEFKDNFKDFHETRKVKNEVIAQEFSGIKVYNDSLIKRESQVGVFIEGIGNEMKFVPVKVLQEFEGYSIVQEKYFYLVKNDTREKIETLKVNDVIYRDGSKYLTNGL